MKVTMEELDNAAEDDLDQDFKSTAKPNHTNRTKYNRQTTLKKDELDSNDNEKESPVEEYPEDDIISPEKNDKTERFIRGYTKIDEMVAQAARQRKVEKSATSMYSV